jgi:hypothetical protein
VAGTTKPLQKLGVLPFYGDPIIRQVQPFIIISQDDPIPGRRRLRSALSCRTSAADSHAISSKWNSNAICTANLSTSSCMS